MFSLSISSYCFSGKNGVRGESGVSDDDLASDVLSHYSSASETASVPEEGSGTHSHMFTNTLMMYTCTAQ